MVIRSKSHSETNNRENVSTPNVNVFCQTNKIHANIKKERKKKNIERKILKQIPWGVTCNYKAYDLFGNQGQTAGVHPHVFLCPLSFANYMTFVWEVR